jgi:hypothetical protein
VIRETQGKRPLDSLGVGVVHNIQMILKGMGCGLYSVDSGWVPMTGSCKHGNEPSASMKALKFLDQLNYLSFSWRALFVGIS